MTSVPPPPNVNPFGGPEFARLWQGWRGRRVEPLTAGAFTAPYVVRSLGPLRTLDALPFGIPVLLNDFARAERDWIDRFFQLGRSVRSTCSLFQRPRSTYIGVVWQEQMRSVVHLDSRWDGRVDGDIKRRSRRARSEGWRVGSPHESIWPLLQPCVVETDLRHGADERFDHLFLQRLHQLLSASEQLVIMTAERDAVVGGVNVVLRAGGYETSWLLYATDAARADGVVPFLWYSWLQECAERGAAAADLGASPTESVQKFKATFGAGLVPYYTGTRRWNITGGH